jgi:outer membrane protein OmpA-like peptidoglycan-associated protein
MRKLFIIITILSGCGQLPNKEGRQIMGTKQVMAKDSKHVFTFCKLGLGGNDRCPEVTVKTLYESNETEQKLELLQAEPVNNETQSEPILSLEFLKNSTELYPESIDDFDRNFEKLRGQNVILRGYTDNTGGQKVNDILALKRAQKVKNMLREKGLINEEIKFEGNALCCFLNSNMNEGERRNNRRVEVKLGN